MTRTLNAEIKCQPKLISSDLGNEPVTRQEKCALTCNCLLVFTCARRHTARNLGKPNQAGDIAQRVTGSNKRLWPKTARNFFLAEYS
jgi:hypothetical protein